MTLIISLILKHVKNGQFPPKSLLIPLKKKLIVVKLKKMPTKKQITVMLQQLKIEKIKEIYINY